eukprot:Hpha_TRINITY_DN12541_c0_g1::TRINITY_DN12541_c0_g1_i1::g.50966::m.50966
MADKVIIEQKGAVGWITLNNPDRGNCVGNAGLLKLTDYFQGLRMNKEVRVVVLRSSSSKTFSTGLDLKESAMEFMKWGKKPDAIERAFDTQLRWGNVIRAMRACPQPILSCIDGLAMGGGFALALASDIRVATEHSKMNVQMIKVGLTGCDLGIAYFLPRIVGMSNAAHLMYTGRLCDTKRALRMGLISDVYPNRAEMEKGAEELVAEMLESDPFGLRLTKQGLSLAVDAPSLEAVMAMEDRQQVMLSNSPGMIKAVAKKSKPKL